MKCRQTWSILWSQTEEAETQPARRPPCRPSPWTAAWSRHLVVSHADVGPDVVVSDNLLLTLRLGKANRGTAWEAGMAGFPQGAEWQSTGPTRVWPAGGGLWQPGTAPVPGPGLWGGLASQAHGSGGTRTA